MAKGKKTGGRNFTKGGPGGPGRTPLTKEAKQLKEMTTDEFTKRVNKYLLMSRQQLIKGIGSKKMPMIDLYIRNSLVRGSDKGDYYTLDCMLNRIIGRPKEAIAISGSVSLAADKALQELLAKNGLSGIRDMLKELVKRKEKR
jgi:hypothetical protein